MGGFNSICQFVNETICQFVDGGNDLRNHIGD